MTQKCERIPRVEQSQECAVEERDNQPEDHNYVFVKHPGANDFITQLRWNIGSVGQTAAFLAAVLKVNLSI